MIGIIFCGYNSEPYVRAALSPFLKRDDCFISAVSVPFKEYESQQDYEDETTNILREHAHKGEIKLVEWPRFIPEFEARNLALHNIPSTVDYYWMVDADEIYTDEDIDAIIKFVEENEQAWYRICLKNFVCDTKTYMEEPFCPPRIFKTHFNGDFGPEFYWDNDICYNRLGENQKVDYKALPNETIPKEVAWIAHYSWLNDEIGKRKVAYQQNHFGHCSFKWGEKGLEFDEEYFEKTGEEKPKLIYEG